MDDLFKQFKENLNNREEPDFDTSDWMDLQSQMDQEKQPKNRMAYGWLSLGLLLLLIGSNGLWWFLNHTSSSTTELTVYQVDTVRTVKTIYRTDTVYLGQANDQLLINNTKNAFIKAQQKKMTVHPYFANTSTNLLVSAKLNTKFNKPIVSMLSVQQSKSQSDQVDASLPGKFIFSDQGNRMNNKKGRINKLTPMLPVDLLPLANTLEESLLADNYRANYSFIKKRKKIGEKLYYYLPKSIEVGPLIGALRPTNSVGTYGVTSMYGLGVSVDYNSNLSLLTNIFQVTNHFETGQIDPAIGVPIVAPPADDYLFEKAVAKIPGIMFNMNIVYTFMPEKKWRPYLGVGSGVIHTSSYDVVYEFENSLNGTELSVEQSVYSNLEIDNYLVLRAGWTYDITPKLNTKVGLVYHADWGNKGQQWSKLMELSAGCFYRFNIK